MARLTIRAVGMLGVRRKRLLRERFERARVSVSRTAIADARFEITPATVTTVVPTRDDSCDHLLASITSLP
jgi:hypothetical protein